MKKKFLFIIAMSLLCSACTIKETEEEEIIQSHIQSETEVEVTPVLDFSSYTYQYEDKRNLSWEQDIVYITKMFLLVHPKLADVYYNNAPEFSISYNTKDAVSAYDEQLKNVFIENMSDLIFKIAEMKDNEIIYEMQRIIAMLEDGHSCVLFETDSIFPIYYETIKKDGVMRYYAVNVPKEQKELAFSYLESINNIPVEEMIDRFCSYISADSEVWKQKKIFDSLNHGWIMQTEALQIIGVLKENDNSAEFCFVKEDGTKQKVVINAVAEILSIEEMELNSFETIPTIRYKNLEHNYWYEHMGEDILYLRINSCFEETGKPVEEFTSRLVDDIKKLPEQAKVVIDFRGNIGGYPFFFDWEKVANSLNERKNLNTYILIDEGCYSAGVIVPYSVKQLIKNSVLAGTPAGQNPNMCGSTREYVLPNSKYTVAISNYYTEFWPNYEYETLLPDITIYQTLEDYKQGTDTVLEAIKGME